MVTLAQFKRGMERYAEEEIMNKMAGVRKWLIALSIPPVIESVCSMMECNKDMLLKAGYISEDGMIDIDHLHSEAKRIAEKTGSVTEHLPVIGDVKFSSADIDLLRNYIAS